MMTMLTMSQRVMMLLSCDVCVFRDEAYRGRGRGRGRGVSFVDGSISGVAGAAMSVAGGRGDAAGRGSRGVARGGGGVRVGRGRGGGAAALLTIEQLRDAQNAQPATPPRGGAAAQ